MSQIGGVWTEQRERVSLTNWSFDLDLTKIANRRVQKFVKRLLFHAGTPCAPLFSPALVRQCFAS